MAPWHEAQRPAGLGGRVISSGLSKRSAIAERPWRRAPKQKRGVALSAQALVASR